MIRKDYPTTGVLKLEPTIVIRNAMSISMDQEGLPDYWGIETPLQCLLLQVHQCFNQEGLPDYWGIETHHTVTTPVLYSFFDQEGLPDYWGIETSFCDQFQTHALFSNESGRITRLLGY